MSLMNLHSTLTGTDLHESKGVAAAAVNTVAVADGSGSTAWKLLPFAALDTTAIKNINIEYLFTDIIDMTVVNSEFVLYVPFACNITSITYICMKAGTITGPTITVEANGFTPMDTGVFGATVTLGESITHSVTTQNTIVAGNYIKIISTGDNTASGIRCGIILTAQMT